MVLLWTVAAFGMGCRPYQHGRVGVSVDIHSKDHHKEDGRRHDDQHDDDHHDRDDHHDDDQ